MVETWGLLFPSQNNQDTNISIKQSTDLTDNFY